MQCLIRLFCLLICFGLSINTAKAKSCPPPPIIPDQTMAESAIKQAKDHGFLWRISKDGRDSYLYGTIHLAKFEDMFVGPTVLNAVNQSDTVALELDMLNQDISLRLSKGMKSAKGNAIPLELSNQIKQTAKTICLPYEQMASMAPEFQMITLLAAQAAYDKLYGTYSIDAFLSGYAHQLNKKVVSLETPEIQISTLLMDTPQETRAFIKKSLDQIKTGQSQKIVWRMYQGWLGSNKAEFNNYAQWCECLETDKDKKFMKRMLQDRNTGMADKINQLHLKKHSVFAAVGTLHLFGDSSLPELMRQKGYQIEQMMFR